MFIAPAILIPILTLGIAFLTGRQFVVAASIWVQPSQLLSEGGSSSSRNAPNLIEAQVINDRLATEDFRGQIMDRSGLTDVILDGQWPQPTRVQEVVNSNGILRKAAKILGLAAPQNPNEAIAYALSMVGDTLKVKVIGDNVVVVWYEGPEPQLGQRLLEETINVHKEERIASQIRETEAGVEYLTRQLESQQQRLQVSTENLLRFEEEFPPPPLGLQRPPDELEQLQQLRQAQQLDQTLYLDTLSRLENLRIRSDASISTSDLHIQVIDAPFAGNSGATISIRKMGMMGMMGVTIGLILGTVFIVVITWRDGVIRTTSDVRRMIGEVSVVELPEVSVSNDQRAGVLRAATGLKQRSAEQASL